MRMKIFKAFRRCINRRKENCLYLLTDNLAYIDITDSLPAASGAGSISLEGRDLSCKYSSFTIAQKKKGCLIFLDKPFSTLSTMKKQLVELSLLTADNKSISMHCQTLNAFKHEFLHKRASLEWCLIRENICSQLLNMKNHTDNTGQHQLIQKLQWLPIENTTTITDQSPVQMHIEYLIPNQNDGIFGSGWIYDPKVAIKKIELISQYGHSIELKQECLYYTNRLDVTEHLQNIGKLDHSKTSKYGICFYYKYDDQLQSYIDSGLTLNYFRAKVTLTDGVSYDMTPPSKECTPIDAKTIILQACLGISMTSDAEIMSNVINPALKAASYKGSEPPKVIRTFTYGIENKEPIVSIVIPLFKSIEHIKTQFAVMANDPHIKEKCELIYVLDSPECQNLAENIVRDNSILFDIPAKLLILNKNSGFSVATNIGTAAAKGIYLLLMNSDVLPIKAGWLEKMVSFLAANKDVGIVGPKLLYADNSIQHAGMFFEKKHFSPYWLNSHYFKGLPENITPANISRAVPAVTGACALISNALYKKIGGLSTEYILADFEDSDLCLKCEELGFKSWYMADVSLYHLERTSVPLNENVNAVTWAINAQTHTAKWDAAIKRLRDKHASELTKLPKNGSMRILIFANSHPRHIVGGSGVVAYSLFREIQDKTKNADPIFIAAGNPIFKPSTIPNISFQALDGAENEIIYWGEGYDTFSLTYQTDDIATLTHTLNPDIVHFQHYWDIGLNAIPAIKSAMPETKIFMSLHDFLLICFNDGRMVSTKGELCTGASPWRCHNCFPEKSAHEFKIRELTAKALLAHVDKFISPSQFLADRYIAWGLPKEKIIVKENGIIKQITARTDTSQERKRNRFCFLGQVLRHKGISTLLNAARHLTEEGFRDFQIVINGRFSPWDKPFEEESKEQIEALHPYVKYNGEYNNLEIASVLKDADWTIVPSVWWENSPLTIQESFMHKRPVICSNIGGMAEKVSDGINGLHFGMGDHIDLAEKIKLAATSNNMWANCVANIPETTSVEDSLKFHMELYEGNYK